MIGVLRKIWRFSKVPGHRAERDCRGHWVQPLPYSRISATSRNITLKQGQDVPPTSVSVYWHDGPELDWKTCWGPRRLLPPIHLYVKFWWPVSLCFPLWQIFQAQGSYSFLVCGVIFGGLAFTFYILLLFFHRMHPGLSSGKERICFYTRGGKQSRGARGRCCGS